MSSVLNKRERGGLQRHHAGAVQVPRVCVEPTSDEYRRFIKHPSGIGFRSVGPADWPFDRFTKRRIADGSVRIVDPKREGGDDKAPQRPHRHAPPEGGGGS